MMSTVSISDLKANLSRYLREVRRGGEIQVLDRVHQSPGWCLPQGMATGIWTD